MFWINVKSVSDRKNKIYYIKMMEVQIGENLT